MKNLIIFCAVIGTVVLLALPRTDHPSICFFCRAERHTGNWGPFPYSITIRSNFSKWYVKRFPNHQHHWWPLGTYHYFLGGLGGASRHGVGGLFYSTNPMWHISDQSQQAFLTAATPEEISIFQRELILHQPAVVNMILGKRTPPEVLCCGWTCPKKLEVSKAIPVEHNGTTYYFCSSNCIQETIETDTWGAREPHLATWQSPQASVWGKSQAVKALIPEGMRMKEVKAVLGSDCRAFRPHSPTRSDLGILYSFPGGYVGLLVKKPYPDKWWDEGEFSGGLLLFPKHKQETTQ